MAQQPQSTDYPAGLFGELKRVDVKDIEPIDLPKDLENWLKDITEKIKLLGRRSELESHLLGNIIATFQIESNRIELGRTPAGAQLLTYADHWKERFEQLNSTVNVTGIKLRTDVPETCKKCGQTIQERR